MVDPDGGWSGIFGWYNAWRARRKAIKAGLDPTDLYSTKVNGNKEWGFNLGTGGTVFSPEEGKLMFGVTTTFQYTDAWQKSIPGQITAHVPNIFERQKNSLAPNPNDKLGEKGVKSLLNVFYNIGDEAFVFSTGFAAVQDLAGIPGSIHLDGSFALPKERIDAGVNTLIIAAPWAKSTKVLNASQYSKAFNTKGVSAKVRGEMNRVHNITAKEISKIKDANTAAKVPGTVVNMLISNE